MLDIGTIVRIAILKQHKSLILVLLPTWTILVHRMINESQNQEPVSKYDSFLWNTSNGPNAAYFMFPLSNTELRNYLD